MSKKKHKNKQYRVCPKEHDRRPEDEIPEVREWGTKSRGESDRTSEARVVDTKEEKKTELGAEGVEKTAPVGDVEKTINDGRSEGVDTPAAVSTEAEIPVPVDAAQSEIPASPATEDTREEESAAAETVAQDAGESNGFSFNIMFRDHAEDAEPYRDGNVVAVADGMGGAGAGRLFVDADDVRTIEKIVAQAVKSEFGRDTEGDVDRATAQSDCSFGASWAKYAAYMSGRSDGEDRSVTHAAVASRIIMAVFDGAMNVLRRTNGGKTAFDETFAVKLRRALCRALCQTADQLKIRLPQHDLLHVSVLPGTFVAACVDDSVEGMADIHVIWAGDSRCYRLDEDGLRVLSEDEEDASGALVNYMNGGDRPVALNYARYCCGTSKPFAVFVCSDGLFDMTGGDTECGLAKKFADAFAEARGMREAGDRLRALCEPRVGDDCSVSFIAFGGFEGVRDAAVRAGAKFAKIAAEKERLYYDIQYADHPENLDNLCRTMQNRCRLYARDIAEKIFALGTQEKGAEMFGEIVALAEVCHDTEKEAEAILGGAKVVFERTGQLVETVGKLVDVLRDAAGRVSSEGESAMNDAERKSMVALVAGTLNVANGEGVEYRVELPADDGETVERIAAVVEKYPQAVVETVAAHGMSVAVGFNPGYALVYEGLFGARMRAGENTESQLAALKRDTDDLVRRPEPVLRRLIDTDY